MHTAKNLQIPQCSSTFVYSKRDIHKGMEHANTGTKLSVGTASTRSSVCSAPTERAFRRLLRQRNFLPLVHYGHGGVSFTMGENRQAYVKTAFIFDQILRV